MTGFDTGRVRAMLSEAVPHVGRMIDIGLGRDSLAIAVIPDAIGTRPWVVRITGDRCRIKDGRGAVVERLHRGPADDAALLAELGRLLALPRSRGSRLPLRLRQVGRAAR